MFDTATFLKTLRQELTAGADLAHSKGQHSFFKEPINPLGVRSRELNAIVSHHWPDLKRLEPAQLLGLCDALWQSDTFEDPVLASKWCARALPRLGPDAFALFEVWLQERVANWAHCDVLCSSCIGGLLVRRPELVDRLTPWLASQNRWVRRGAAVSLVPAARRGLLSTLSPAWPSRCLKTPTTWCAKDTAGCYGRLRRPCLTRCSPLFWPVGTGCRAWPCVAPLNSCRSKGAHKPWTALHN
jgi:3-methyladenine DNA glycosylase AlkD